MIKWCDSSKCHQITCKNVILLLLKLTLSPVNILQVMGATGAYNRGSRTGMHVCCYSRSGGHNRSSFLVAYTVRNREYLRSRKQVLSYKRRASGHGYQRPASLWLILFLPQMFLMLARCLRPEPLRRGWRMVFEKCEVLPFLELPECRRNFKTCF